MRKLVLFILLMNITVSSHAAWHASTINRMHITSGKVLILYLDQPNPHCGQTYAMQLLDSNAPGADWIFSALLTAQSMKRKVYFNVVNCEDGGKFDRIEDKQN